MSGRIAVSGTAPKLPMDPGDRQILEFRTAVLQRYLLIGCIVGALSVPVYVLIGLASLAICCAVFAGLMAVLAVLLRGGRLTQHATAQLFLASLVWVCLSGLWYGDEMTDNKPWQMIIPIVAFTVTSARLGAFWTGMSVLGTISVFVLRSPAYPVLPAAVLLFAYLTAAYVLYAFNRYNEQNIRTIAHLSHTDPLTATYNRQLFDELSQSLFNQARRNGEPLAVYMIDIDHFKRFNDRYGHVSGDRALREVAAVLSRSARRATDLVFRYGGEEFCIVSSMNDSDDALALAHTIVSNIRALDITHADGEDGLLTVSVGLSHLTEFEGETVASVLRDADQALYLAKERGRDCVVGTARAGGVSAPLQEVPA